MIYKKKRKGILYCFNMSNIAFDGITKIQLNF